MCEPATIVVIAGAVLSAYGQVEQGRAAESAANYNARVQENEATQLRNIAVERENEQREQTAQLLSRQRAQFAASGVDIDAGSALAVQQDTEQLGEISAQRIRRNLGEQASSLEGGAGLTRSQGSAARFQGNVGAAGTLLQTASTTLDSKWFNSKSVATRPGGNAPIAEATPLINR